MFPTARTRQRGGASGYSMRRFPQQELVNVEVVLAARWGNDAVVDQRVEVFSAETMEAVDAATWSLT